MPQKRNFLGGMQNYNKSNGEYESALVGPGGKVVKDADGDGIINEAKSEKLKTTSRKYGHKWEENEKGEYVQVTTKNGKVIKKGMKVDDDYYVTGFDPTTNTVYMDSDPNTDGGADYSVDDVEDWFEEEKDFNEPVKDDREEKDYLKPASDRVKKINEIANRKGLQANDVLKSVEEDVKKEKFKTFDDALEQRYKELEQDFNEPLKDTRIEKAYDKDGKEIPVKTKKHDYSEIFDEDYQRSYGIPKFEDETDIKKLNDIVEKAMEYDGEEGAIDISNNAMERIGELTTFTEEEQDKLASGTGEEIMDILRSKEKKELTFESAVKSADDDVLDEEFGKGTPERKLVGAIKEDKPKGRVPWKKEYEADPTLWYADSYLDIRDRVNSGELPVKVENGRFNEDELYERIKSEYPDQLEDGTLRDMVSDALMDIDEQEYIKEHVKPQTSDGKYYKHPQVPGVWHKAEGTGRHGFPIFENEEGERWEMSDEYFKANLVETQKPKESFKLDNKKYPDVEETPYGFIYNVNGKSITDLADQSKKLGYSLFTNDKGFAVAIGNEEVYFDTFEDAYNYAKGNKQSEKLTYDKFFESSSNKQIVDDYVSDYFDRAKRQGEQANISADQILEEFKKDWNGFYSEETLPLIKERIQDKIGYPKGTSKEYTQKINKQFDESYKTLKEKYGFTDEQLKSDKVSETLSGVHQLFDNSQFYGGKSKWNKEQLKEIADALDVLDDKYYNDYYIRLAPRGY